jgi:hypothetical protein
MPLRGGWGFVCFALKRLRGLGVEVKDGLVE